MDRGLRSARRTAILALLIDVDVGLELSEAYSLVDRCIIHKWQISWDNESTGSHYRAIAKTVSTKLKYLHHSRHTDVVITRLRLGKCCLNAYLHQIGKHPDGLCHSCNINQKLFHTSSQYVPTA